ncbi:hypothetical protein BKA70DRAFT_1309094, partial [Coprinopsis sp. MPI-PUGE-AT-0042]
MASRVFSFLALSLLCLQTVATPAKRQLSVVLLGGQCGGIGYDGPTFCLQRTGQVIGCVIVTPEFHQCQILDS